MLRSYYQPITGLLSSQTLTFSLPRSPKPWRRRPDQSIMSQYIVSARKYRPSTFTSVVGQGHVTETLTHSLLSGQVAHAYLFCGPRGVGKTTVARIFAKAVNCDNLSDKGEACNKCASCKAFDVNSSFNIFELDGASNNSVDDIRSLVEQVRIPPSVGKYKVYIIDEVHMLSTSAFNAFLKTLEEPPSYVKFILATTEKHKILPTILSRCQSFDFRRIPVSEIASHLKQICTSESIQAEDEALMIISQKGDGSLRDSLSIFDRIASQSRGNITYESVLSNLQLLDYDYFFKITDALVKEDMTGIFLLLADIQQRGFDGEAFITGFSEHLRDILLCKDTATADLLSHGEKIKSRYMHQASVLPKSSLVTYLELLNDCDIHYARALNKWLHIEMTLVRMCYIHRRTQGAAIPEPVSEKKKSDQSNELKNAPGENGHGSKVVIEPVKQANGSTEADKDVIEEKSIPETSQSTPETKEVVAPAEKGQSKGIPSLQRLGDLKRKAASIHEEEKKKIPVLTLSTVTDFWKEYSETHTSPSVKLTMTEAILEVKDEKTLVIRTGTQAGKNRLIAETNLLEGLRSLVRIPNLQIMIDIDPDLDRSKELVKPKKLLTNREKFDLLSKKNPLIQDLREKLDLIPDQDD